MTKTPEIISHYHCHRFLLKCRKDIRKSVFGSPQFVNGTGAYLDIRGSVLLVHMFRQHLHLSILYFYPIRDDLFLKMSIDKDQSFLNYGYLRK